jgi:ABC-2 type transport system permease protein
MTTLAAAPKATFGRTLHSEWIKFRSLRSTWYTLAGLFAIGLGVTALSMSSVGAEYANATPAERLEWDPTNLSLMSHLVAQLVIGVLGILTVTSEYATGMMSTSLSATPRRHRLLAAKALLVTAVALVAGQALMFASFLVAQALMASQDVPNASLGDDGALAAVAGGGLYLGSIALLAVGLGAILRTTAGALAALVGVVFVVPGFSGIFPDWFQVLLDYWPSLGASAVLTTVPDPAYPHPWLNLGGLCLGVAAVLAAGFVLFRRRDV